jgi:hypothetical protein
LRELQGELAGASRVLEKLSALGLLHDAPRPARFRVRKQRNRPAG